MSCFMLHVVTAVIGAIALAYGIFTIKVGRAVAQAASKVDWVCDTLERAARQLESEEVDDIVSGLQVIGTYNVPEVRAKLLKRVEELRANSSEVVAKQAEWTREAIVWQTALPKKRPGQTN